MPGTRLRPTGLAGRVLAPDLARGVMLLLIAVANSHYFVRGESYLVGFPLDGTALSLPGGPDASLRDGPDTDERPSRRIGSDERAVRRNGQRILRPISVHP